LSRNRGDNGKDRTGYRAGNRVAHFSTSETRPASQLDAETKRLEHCDRSSTANTCHSSFSWNEISRKSREQKDFVKFAGSRARLLSEGVTSNRSRFSAFRRSASGYPADRDLNPTAPLACLSNPAAASPTAAASGVLAVDTRLLIFLSL
jgi:hypothetical protein